MVDGMYHKYGWAQFAVAWPVEGETPYLNIIPTHPTTMHLVKHVWLLL